MGTVLSKSKNAFMQLSIKLENSNLILTEGFGVVCEVRKNLFLNRSQKVDKCQFPNLGSHFSERVLLGCVLSSSYRHTWQFSSSASGIPIKFLSYRPMSGCPEL